MIVSSLDPIREALALLAEYVEAQIEGEKPAHSPNTVAAEATLDAARGALDSLCHSYGPNGSPEGDLALIRDLVSDDDTDPTLPTSELVARALAELQAIGVHAFAALDRSLNAGWVGALRTVLGWIDDTLQPQPGKQGCICENCGGFSPNDTSVCGNCDWTKLLRIGVAHVDLNSLRVRVVAEVERVQALRFSAYAESDEAPTSERDR